MKNKLQTQPFHLIRLILACAVSLFALWASPRGPFSMAAKATAPDKSSTFLPIAWNGIAFVDSPSPTPPSPPKAPPAQEGWLSYLNYYRALAGLFPLAENKSWGDGSWFHSRYMVKNDFIGHEEDPANSWYTSDGNAAAQSSNLVVSSSIDSTDNFAIDSWMQAPFHALHILDPALEQVGFGSFREEDGGLQMGATLDVLRGMGTISASIKFPIAWPANGATVPFGSYWGEYPDPLTSCPGYIAPAGLPILLQLGEGGVIPEVTGHSFKEGKTKLEHCVFDETNYKNSDSVAQGLGRSILDSHDAIVLIPRQPLVPGASYTVSITVNGQTHTWSFAVAGEAAQLATLSGSTRVEFLIPEMGSSQP